MYYLMSFNLGYYILYIYLAKAQCNKRQYLFNYFAKSVDIVISSPIVALLCSKQYT